MIKLRRSWVVTAVVGALFVFAAANAIFESREALHYREISGAAQQLELAAHTLSMIELIDEPPVEVLDERTEAVALLEGDSAFRRTGLNSTQRSRAIALSGDLTENAVTDAQTDRGDTQELLQLLNDDATQAETRGMRAERAAYIYVLGSAVSGLAIVWLVLSAQDRERKLKKSLRIQAFTDFLTGLPNRRELPVCFDVAKEEMLTAGTQTGMLYMDLDGFKEVNDAGGHASGDEILKEVARTLQMVQQPNETLVRLGGDEFGVVLRNLDSTQQALSIAERYRTSIGGEPDDVVQISIGVAVTDDVDMLAELQNQANLAMYEAKQSPGSTVALYEEELGQTASRTSQLLRALRTADLNDEFFLEYQPVVGIEDEGVFFVEALARWHNPAMGRVGPDEFVPLAESSGEISRIGEWVIQSAFAQLVQWQKNPLTKHLSISVNVSIHQLEAGDFIDRLLSASAGAGGLDPAKLIIEVTESSATGPVVMERLADIRSLGYRVAIDDFGSGYSNLAQLIHTPFDILKIDRELISSLEKLGEDGKKSIEVLSAVSAIARAQGAPVVCEGVEEERQLQPLLDADISHIQGWLISKAVSPDELTVFLDQRAPLPLAA